MGRLQAFVGDSKDKSLNYRQSGGYVDDTGSILPERSLEYPKVATMTPDGYYGLTPGMEKVEMAFCFSKLSNSNAQG